MEAKEMAKLAIQALEDKKAEDVKVIDISDISTIADYFIIASGKNHSQIQALCDNVDETHHHEADGGLQKCQLDSDGLRRYHCTHL